VGSNSLGRKRRGVGFGIGIGKHAEGVAAVPQARVDARRDRSVRTVVAFATAVVLAIGGWMLSAAPSQASTNASGTVVGGVTWPSDLNMDASSIWTLGTGNYGSSTYTGTAWGGSTTYTLTYGIGAAASSSAKSATPTTPVKLSFAGGGYPQNLAVSDNAANPGIYVTKALALDNQGAASTAAKAQYTALSFTQSGEVEWASANKGGTSALKTVEIPIPTGWTGTTCGMEVNPVTNELVIMNDCTPGTQTGYWVLNPGADNDPTTIADNSMRYIKAASAGLDGGDVSDMTLDAAGNIYNLSSHAGTSGDIIRTDGTTGVATDIGSYTPDSTATSACARGESMAFYNGHIINITNNASCDSLGINPLTLKSQDMTGTNYSHLSGFGTPWLDGAGTSGAVAVEGKVLNSSDSSALSGQVVAAYRSNSDGTATLVASDTTASDGSYNFLLDSDSDTFYFRVVEPTLTTSSQIKNGEVTSIDTSFTTGASSTSSTISSTGGNNGINPALGTVGTTKITVADINDLVTYDVKDAKAVASANFSVTFAGSTADRNSNAALTTTAATGYGPQHVSVADKYRLGDSNGSYLIGATDDSHTTDNGVNLSLNGTTTTLSGQKFVAGLDYTLIANSQGTDAANAVISAFAGSNTATAWSSMGSISSASGAGNKSLTFTPSSAGSATLRFNTSNAAITSATNASGEYAATSGTAGTKAWTTAGEVEDYAGTILATTSSLTRLQQANITGTPTYTYSGAGSTAGSTTITDSGFATSAIAGTSGTFTVTASNIPTGYTLAKVLQINTITGATTATLTPSGNAVTPTIAAGTDTILKFVYKAAASASTSTISASPSSTVAGTDSTVTVTLKDASGNSIGVGGDTVAISSSLGSVGSVTDNGDGTYTATLTSAAAGTANLSFTVNGTAASATDSVSFNTGAVSSANSTVAIDSATAVSVDGGSHTITVTLKDDNGNLVAGQASSLSADGATVGSFTETSDGVYTAKVTSTTSGTKAVTVTHSDAGTLSPTVAANFKAGAVDASNSTVAIDNSTAVSVDDGSHTVTVTLKDANDNLVSGAAGSLSASVGSGVSVSAFTEVATGVYTATVTSTSAGSKTVTVSHSTAGELSPTVTAKYAAGAISAANSSYTVSTGSKTIGSQTHTVTVTLKDQYGNTVTGATTSNIVASSTDSHVSVGDFTDAGSGTYTASISATYPGTFPISATYSGVDITAGANTSAHFVSGSVDLTNAGTGYQVSTGTVASDGNATHTITVTLADSNGLPVTGKADALTAAHSGNLGSGTLGSFTEDSAHLGTYTATVTSTVSGSKAITVKLDSDSLTKLTGANTDAVFGAGSVDTSNAGTNYTVDNSGTVAVGAQRTITVHLVDSGDTPITGKASSLTAKVDGSLSSGTFTVGDFTEDAANPGTYTATVSSTVAGDRTVTVFYAGSNAINVATGGTATASFVAGAFDASSAYNNFTVTTGTKVADGSAAHTVTVNTFDSYGNAVAVPDVSKLAAAVTGLGTGSVSSWTTSATGVYTATLTSTVSGAKAVAVSYDSTTINVASSGNDTATFVPGVASAANSKIAVSKSSIKGDGTTTAVVTVTTYDAFGNRTSSDADVAISTSAGSVSATINNSDGTYQTTLTSAVVASETSATLSFTVDAIASTNTATVVFTDGTAPSAPTLNPTNGTSVSGTAEAGSTVTVKAADGTVLCTTTADASTGSFTCVPSSTPADGDVLSVTATDSNGNTSAAATVTVDRTAPAKPDVNPTRGDVISGTGDAGTTITVTDDAGQLVCSATVASDGSWSCTPTTTPADGTVLTVTSSDAAGNTSGSASVTVDSTAPSAPAVSPTNGKTVSGTAEAGATVTITYTGTDGQSHTTVVTAGSDGSFSATLSPNAANGTQVWVTATDAAGNTSDATQVKVDSVAPDAPVVNASNGELVSGTAEPGTTVTLKYTDASGDTHTTTVTVGSNGSWTTTLSPVAADSTTITATAKDAAGNVSADGTTTVDSTAPSQPAVAPSNGKTVSVSGVESGATPSLVDSTGAVVAGTWTDNGSGNWTFHPDTDLTESDQVGVVLTDGVGNASDSVAVVIDTTAPAAPTAQPTNGASLTGSAEAGSTVTITYTDVNGDQHTVTIADSTGGWSAQLVPAALDGSTIQITATDLAGNVSVVTTLTVDSTAPDAPTLNPTNGSSVSGTAEAGAKVTVTYVDASGTSHVVVTTADASGAWSVGPLSPAAANATSVSATATDTAGNTSTPATVTVDATAPAAPSVDPTNGSDVSGSAEPGSTVTISYTDADGNAQTKTVTAAADGSWSATLSPAAADGSDVSVTATDAAGNTSPSATETVDATAPAAPSVNPTDGTSVSGSAEAGSTVLVKDASGAVLCTATAASDGSWSCVPASAVSDGAVLTVTATDASGNTSTPATVTVDATAPAAPSVNPTNGTSVSGSAEPGSKVKITYTDADGNARTKTVTAAADGSWSATLSPAAADGSDVSVTATDAAGNTSAPTTVVADSSAPAAPSVDPTNGSDVSGSAEPGSTVTISYTDAAGNAQTATATAAADGSWSATLSPAAADGSDVSVTATDAAGNTSAPTTVVADSSAPAAPSVNPTNGSDVSGSAEPGAKVTITYTDADGNAQTKTVTAGKDGSWSATLSPAAADGSDVSVTATDAAGNTSAPTTVVADSSAPAAPSVNPTNGTDVSGSAEPGATVKITYTDADGKTQTTSVTAGKDGSWSTTLDPAAADGSTISATATDAAGNTSSPATEVADSSKPSAPSVNPCNGQTASGTAEPGAKVTITYTDADGKTQTTSVTAGKDGSWSATLSPVAANATTLTAIATDAAGNSSDPTTVTVDSVVSSPTVNPSNGSEVSGTGEAGATVTIIYTDGSGNKHTTEVVVGDDGTWSAILSPVAADGSQISTTVTDLAGNVSSSTVVKVAAINMSLKWYRNVTGTTQVAYGHNFIPGEVVTGVVSGATPLALGTQVADSNGDVVFTFTVPTGFTLGTHKVTLTGAVSGSVNQTFTLVTAGDAELAFTGATAWAPLGVGVFALLAGWFFVVVARRRREDGQH
jgi:large repetitive protein